jgi:hypothetical protein
VTSGNDSERNGSCVQCAAELDPLRAPALGIAGSRILPFCSDGCKSAYFEAENEREAEAEVAAAEAVARRARARHDLMNGILPADEDEEAGLGTFGLFRRWWRGSGTPAMVALFAVVGFSALALAGYRLLEGATQTAPKRYRPVAEPRPEPMPDAAPQKVAARAEPQPIDPREAWARAKEVLVSFLGQAGTRHQLTAAEMLSKCCGEPKALEVLLKACKDTLWSRRQQAAAALARLGNNLGVKVLKKDLRHRRRAVRWAAAFTLTRLGSRAGLSIVRPLLTKRRYRLTCAEALIKLGDTKARRYLQKVLATEATPSSDRLRAAVALGLNGDARGKGVLLEALKGQRVHLGAALALAHLRDPSASGALVRALDHTALRLEAARALSRLGQQVSLKKLVDRMEDPDVHGQVSAAAAVLLLTRDASADSRRTGGGAQR